MSVHQRGDRWRVRYRNKGEKNPRSFSMPKGTTRREAERLDREIKLTIDTAGAWFPARAAPVDLEQLVDAYIRERTAGTAEKPAARPATLRMYQTVLRQLFLGFCRGRAVAAPGLAVLNRDAVSGFLAQRRAKGSKPGTLSAYARMIRAFWGWAARQYPANVALVDMPRVHMPPSKQVLAPTFEEIDRMIAQLTERAEEVRRAALIMRFTGLRVSQAGGFAWDDHDPDWEGRGPALHMRVTKSEQESALDRWIPVAPPLAHLLLAWKMRDGRPEGDAAIVGPAMPRDPHSTTGEAWARAEVPEDRWRGHPGRVFRKRFISHMVEAGVSDAAIDHLMGHAPQGVRARHYVDPRAFWPILTAAVATIPPLNAELSAAICL